MTAALMLRAQTGRMQTGGGDPLKLVCTAVVLAMLEFKFANRRVEWYLVTIKSRMWVQAEIDRLHPAIDGQPLQDWAREYVPRI